MSSWKERKYTIVTEESLDAPDSDRWAACFDGFDLDVDYATGKTEEDAVMELISLHGLPEIIQ
jgi:hypothetical protein